MLKIIPESSNMNKVSSAYLEVIRIVSALYVFIYHFTAEKVGNTQVFSTFKPGVNTWISYYAAHFFVIVFFVLSGFLITMSAKRPGTTFKSFLIARIGRLYSVLIPALILSYLVFAFLIHYKHATVSEIDGSDHLFARFFVNLSFMTQSWNLCSTPPLNNPFWSVNYEFFYYLLMGSLLLLKNKYKIVLFLLIALLAGPKILILFPAWLAGSFLFFASQKVSFSPKFSGIVFFFTLFIVIYAIARPEQFPFIKSTGDNNFFGTNLFFSWNYQSDYIFSILISLNIYAFFGISQTLYTRFLNRGLGKLYGLIKTIGNCTYTLYLFHLPLLLLFAFALPYNKANSLHQIGLIVLVITAVYFIARVTEWKVFFWRSLVNKFFNSTFLNNLQDKVKAVARINLEEES